MGGERAGRSRRVWLLGGCFLLLVLGAGVFVLVARNTDEPIPEYCADVGLIGPGGYPTAKAAFQAWLDANPGEPPISEWDRGPDVVGPNTGRRSVGYSTSSSEHYWRVGVGTGEYDEKGNLTGLGEWSATGACVRSPDE